MSDITSVSSTLNTHTSQSIPISLTAIPRILMMASIMHHHHTGSENLKYTLWENVLHCTVHVALWELNCVEQKLMHTADSMRFGKKVSFNILTNTNG